MPRSKTLSLPAIDAFIIDLDGTTYLGDHLIPGAALFFRRLRTAGKRYAFYTNNSSRSGDAYRRKLTGLGVPVTREQIITSTDATIAWLNGRPNGQRRIYPIGTKSFERELTRAGFTLTDRRVGSVVAGFDRTLTYAKVETACRLIRSGARFVATHPDLLCPTPTGPVPDCGAITAMLTAATGVEPIVCGKPSRAMLRTAMQRLGTTRRRTAIIGDRLYTDIRMGADCGVTTILVLTGEATRAAARTSPYRPDHIVDRLTDIRF